MDKWLCMPEISEENFIANVEKDDFLLRCGNPVLIREKNGDGLVCMAVEYYKCLAQEPEGFLERKYQKTEVQ